MNIVILWAALSMINESCVCTDKNVGKKRHNYRLHIILKIPAIMIFLSFIIILNNGIRYYYHIKTYDGKVEYSDEMRNINMTDEEVEELYVLSEKTVKTNKRVIADIVYENMFKAYTEGNILKKQKQNNVIFKMCVDLFAKEAYEKCYEIYESLMEGNKVFPVATDGSDNSGKKVYGYEDSWGFDRSYGGDRKHEGTDIMSASGIRGELPLISICDGIVEKCGWLELGGYRVGIRSDKGAYMYYAHLAQYADGIKEGKVVKAGEVLGTMGDTGYSKVQGTSGNFEVHLHFGMYINDDKSEISYNPYNILRALEKCVKKYISIDKTL